MLDHSASSRALVILMKLFLLQEELNNPGQGGLGSYHAVVLVSIFLRIHEDHEHQDIGSNFIGLCLWIGNLSNETNALSLFEGRASLTPLFATEKSSISPNSITIRDPVASSLKDHKASCISKPVQKWKAIATKAIALGERLQDLVASFDSQSTAPLLLGVLEPTAEMHRARTLAHNVTSMLDLRDARASIDCGAEELCGRGRAGIDVEPECPWASA